MLKVQSFRYFRFFPDGTVTYALTHAPPQRMARPLANQAAQAAAAALTHRGRVADGPLKPEVGHALSTARRETCLQPSSEKRGACPNASVSPDCLNR